MDISLIAEDLGLDEKDYLELLDLFLSTSRDDLETLAAAIAAGDCAQGTFAAHSLKGAAGNIGLAEFSDTARYIEEVTRRGSFDGVAEAAQVLRNSLEHLARSCI
ncbi:MAG: Hpt domain-containing protein [Desulfobacteraceae bacterium]|jgi:HPt (histidine-containing phosphotransfer) domain-containing protein